MHPSICLTFKMPAIIVVPSMFFGSIKSENLYLYFIFKKHSVTIFFCSQSQFLALVSEAKGLLSNTLHFGNLQSIITWLINGGKSNKCLAREQLMQATMDNYMHKITNTYPLYVDCFQPHINGIKLVSITAVKYFSAVFLLRHLVVVSDIGSCYRIISG